jgi:hypothetical protein
MLGAASYDKYKDEDDRKILGLVLDTLRKQMKLTHEPVNYQISFFKVKICCTLCVLVFVDPYLCFLSKDAIPQYSVGHKHRLNKIGDYLVKNKMANSLYLAGNSYYGIGVNDVVFNSRNLCQSILAKSLMAK